MVSFNGRRSKLIIFSLIATFIVLRVFLYFFPNADFDIGAYNVHHIYTGLVIIMFFGLPLCLFSGSNRLLDISALGFGCGLSMALDELVYIIATDGSNQAYLLPVSFWGGVFMVSVAVLWTLILNLVGSYFAGNEPD